MSANKIFPRSAYHQSFLVFASQQTRIPRCKRRNQNVSHQRTTGGTFAVKTFFFAYQVIPTLNRVSTMISDSAMIQGNSQQAALQAQHHEPDFDSACITTEKNNEGHIRERHLCTPDDLRRRAFSRSPYRCHYQYNCPVALLLNLFRR